MTESATPSANWRKASIKGFMEAIGPLLSARDDGGRRFALQTDARHGNTIGFVHGGVIMSLLDQALAHEAWREAERSPTVTVQMDTRFYAAARPGDFLEAAARVVHRTGSLIFVEGQVSCGGKTLAAASAVLKIA